ncbi:BsuBI/PstI family type II restriction endonuclease [Bradyrhizobium sp. LA2.1]|uniref:BsuBI/PstI family type II restriction endonuclease n=1 Tax=Bradyrhizobium sp. LA2.1 TaxID=3156376 RepID=UPI0033980950
MTLNQTILSRAQIQQRLQVIFPEGTPHRGYCVRELAASTVFAALYVGAIEGSSIFFGPKFVYVMTEEQAKRTDKTSRLEYAANVRKANFQVAGKRWYRDNTRESIRDETLREAFVVLGAVIEKADVPTTSSLPRYALTKGFADLFDPTLTGAALDAAITDWQTKTLNKGALARISLVKRGAIAGTVDILVSFPNGETRRMKPGPSSEITKAVIEVFANRFLAEPAVLFVSESGTKVVARDDELAKSVGLQIKADKNLPDTILADLGPEHPLLVFIEVVATDGPINTRRKEALELLVKEAGFPLKHVAFVTAYLDRSGAPFKKTVDSLAWGSYAWFMTEPDGLFSISNTTKRITNG